VLKELGALLKKSIRGSDIACRYGGEEFAIILAMPRREARAQGRRHSRCGQAPGAHHGGKPIGGLTVSLGVALFPYLRPDDHPAAQAAKPCISQGSRTRPGRGQLRGRCSAGRRNP